MVTDKILSDVETPYRILGLLLLGVVRIYSKKVEYLCRECEQVKLLQASALTETTENKVGRRVKKGVSARLVVDQNQQDIPKVKRPPRSVRTSRAENGVTSQTLVEVREAHDAPVDLAAIFIIPKRFELDSFDLQIAENREDDNDDHHQLPRQDTLMEDEQHRMSYLNESYQRMACSFADLDSASFMPAHITLGTATISVIDEVSNLLYSPNREDELENDNQNAEPACNTPVKDVLPPEVMNMIAEVNNLSEKSKSVKKPTRELNTDENVNSASFVSSPESQEIQRSANVVENATCPDLDANSPLIEESEHGLLLEKANTTLSVEIPCHDFEEQESLAPPTLRCNTRTRSINELSPSTPEPMTEKTTGSPEKFIVTTPAKNEKRQVTRKRRRGLYKKDNIDTPTNRKHKRQVKKGAEVLYDEDIVLPNDMMRQAIEDASDLVCKRRKAPHTCLDAWKVGKISSLPDTLMDPLFPCSIGVHFSYSTTAGAPESSCVESVKEKNCLSNEPAESNNSRKDAQNAEKEVVPDEPRNRKLDELNSIKTPVGCYTQSEQIQEDVCKRHDYSANEKSTQVEGDEYSSTGLLEKRLYESNIHSPLFNGPLTADIDYIDEDIPMGEEHTRDEGLLLSTRTRTVARCLHQVFLDKKCQQQGNSPVTLSQALEGRKRKTTARFFYETLNLKSRGLIEVNQDSPYESIVISATPQLELLFQNPE